tara:strand:- start:270 stop:695 length:426 start_codon:yes stop_codon:yes gene_type:complete
MVVFGSGKSQRKLLFVGGGKMKNKTSSIQEPIIEQHEQRKTAKVWFSGAVVRVFETHEKRASLVGALGDEINQIPSNYIPYILLDFQQMTFVCAALWSEEEGIYLMEIDFAAEAFQVGEVFVPENENNEFDDEEVNSVEVH